MKILADSNIIFVKDAFAPFGHVAVSEGRDITREKIKDSDLLLVRSVTPVSAALLEGTPVRFVASATTGTDHVDLRYLRDHAIGFAHAPGSNANSVAEYVVAAIMQCASARGVRVENLTLGIVGVGNVGSRVLALARALGMRCLLNDPPKKNATGSDAFVSLKHLLAGSDIVTLHVPLVSSGPHPTHYLANSEFFSLMKKDAAVVNTSRGDVLDEQALRDNRRHLGYVVLDVWNNEPAPDTRTIEICDLATPHIAGYSYDGKVLGTEMIYDAACSYFFKEKQWQPSMASHNTKPKPVPAKSHGDPVAEAINFAYPILEDDALFRKILSIDRKKRGEVFDEMRTDYPKRFEFCNYVVAAGSDMPASTAAVLAGLGFTMSPR